MCSTIEWATNAEAFWEGFSILELMTTRSSAGVRSSSPLLVGFASSEPADMSLLVEADAGAAVGSTPALDSLPAQAAATALSRRPAKEILFVPSEAARALVVAGKEAVVAAAVSNVSASTGAASASASFVVAALLGVSVRIISISQWTANLDPFFLDLEEIRECYSGCGHMSYDACFSSSICLPTLDVSCFSSSICLPTLVVSCFISSSV
jgi:hypothetical protein